MSLRTEAITFDSLTSDPTSPEDGTAWFNSTDGKYKIRIGGVTKVVQFDPHTHTESDITDLDHDDTDAFHDDESGEINAVVEKTSLDDDDVILIEDSESSYVKKKVKLSNLPGGGVGFGDGYQLVESSARSTTTSNNFQDKVSLTIPAYTGDYRVGWTALVDGAGDIGEARLRDVTDNVTIGGTAVYKPTDAAVRQFVGSFDKIEMTGVAKTIRIQWKDRPGGNTQGISSAFIEVWKIG